MSNNTQTPPPPSGDSQKADEYISKLTKLLSQDKLTVIHTDLTRYEPCTIADHYKIVMQSYEVEVSHTKQPDTGKDYYVMLFNNVRQFEQSNKLILAYIHLNNDQFQVFKKACEEQLDRQKAIEDRKRFEAAMSPIDQALNEVSATQPAVPATEKAPEPAIPAVEPTSSVLQSLATPPSTTQ